MKKGYNREERAIKFDGTSSCGGGNVQYPDRGWQFKKRTKTVASQPKKVYTAHIFTKRFCFKFVLKHRDISILLLSFTLEKGQNIRNLVENDKHASFKHVHRVQHALEARRVSFNDSLVTSFSTIFVHLPFQKHTRSWNR